jgi:hypothetical protein
MGAICRNCLTFLWRTIPGCVPCLSYPRGLKFHRAQFPLALSRTHVSWSTTTSVFKEKTKFATKMVSSSLLAHVFNRSWSTAPSGTASVHPRGPATCLSRFCFVATMGSWPLRWPCATSETLSTTATMNGTSLDRLATGFWAQIWHLQEDSPVQHSRSKSSLSLSLSFSYCISHQWTYS